MVLTRCRLVVKNITWHSHHESNVEWKVLSTGAMFPALLIRTCGTPACAVISLNAVSTAVWLVISSAKRRTLVLGFSPLIHFSVSSRPLAERPMSAMTAAPARANEAAKAYSTDEKRTQ